MSRIRDNEVTIRQWNFPDNTLENLRKLASSNVTEEVKKLGIKKLTGGISPCCVCGDVPSYEIIYKSENAKAGGMDVKIFSLLQGL